MWTDRKCPSGSGEQHSCALPPAHRGRGGDEVGTAQASFLSGPPARRAGAQGLPHSRWVPPAACTNVHPSVCSPPPGCFRKERLLWVCPGDQTTHFVPGERGRLLLVHGPSMQFHNPAPLFPHLRAPDLQPKACSLQPRAPPPQRPSALLLRVLQPPCAGLHSCVHLTTLGHPAHGAL